MYKGIVDGVNAVAGQNIAFTTAWNTNLNTRYDSGNNYIEFSNSGYYDVAVTLVVEDTLISLKTAHEAGYVTIGVDDESSRHLENDKKKYSNKYIYSFKELLENN